MKKNLLVCVFAFCSFCTQAKDSKISYGVTGGMNISRLNYQSGNKTGSGGNVIGVKIGGFAEYNFARIWAVQTGLDFSMKGTNLIDAGGSTMNLRANYLEIPVLAVLRLPISQSSRVRFYAGPSFAYGIGGNTRVNIVGLGTGSAKTFDNLVNRTDIGFKLGFGFEIGKIILALEADAGITSVFNHNTTTSDFSSFRNDCSSIIVGYKF